MVQQATLEIMASFLVSHLMFSSSYPSSFWCITRLRLAFGTTLKWCQTCTIPLVSSHLQIILKMMTISHLRLKESALISKSIERVPYSKRLGSECSPYGGRLSSSSSECFLYSWKTTSRTETWEGVKKIHSCCITLRESNLGKTTSHRASLSWS